MQEELSQAAEESATQAPVEAAAEPVAELAKAAEAEDESDGVERWHAVTADGLVSAHNKHELKSKLRAVPASKLAAIIRGKKIPLQTSVSF